MPEEPNEELVLSAEEALARREADLAKREARQRARETLAAKGLPLELMDVVDLSSEEALDRSLENVEAVFTKSVQRGVEKRLKASIPPGRAVKTADYAAMSDREYYAATYKNKE